MSGSKFAATANPKRIFMPVEYLFTGVSINFSTFYQPIYFPGVLLLDFYKEQGINQLQLKFGIEFNINKYLILRFGTNSNTVELIDSHSSYFSGLSGGIGLSIKKWNIDIGFYNLETAGIISGLSLIYK